MSKTTDNARAVIPTLTPDDPLTPVFTETEERAVLLRMLSERLDPDLKSALEQLVTIQDSRIFGDFEAWEAASEELGQLARDSHIWSQEQAVEQFA